MPDDSRSLAVSISRTPEAYAVLLGLEKAKENEMHNIIVGSDCQELVKARTGRNEGRSTLRGRLVWLRLTGKGIEMEE